MSLESVERQLINPERDTVWEVYHENSKMSWHDQYPINKMHLSDAAVVQMMRRLHDVKPFKGAPQVQLPSSMPASERSFDDVLFNRVSARQFNGGGVGVEQLAKILIMGYGVTRDNAGTHFPRPFRTIPSGGALYPLDIYVYAARVEGLEAGLYHYNPLKHSLDVLRIRDEAARISKFFIQGDLASKAAAVFFITATFARTTFKYGDRGYRFIFLEAGHLAQNANLTAQEMGLATTNVGGYVDRDVDRYLGLDGVNESTVYLMLVGQSDEAEAPAAENDGDETAAATR